jgi:signal transduction histidine kinase
MTLKHIFRKYFLVTVGILFAFVFLANVTLNLILRSNDRPPPIRSPLFFARLLDDLGTDRVKNVKHLNSLNEASLPFQFVLVDENGNAVCGDYKVPADLWKESDLPKTPLEFTRLGHEDEPHPPVPPSFFPFPHAPPPKGAPNAPPPPGPIPRDQVIRLPGAQVQYLVIHFKPDEYRRPPKGPFFALSIALLVVSILLGVGVALAFIFRSLGKKVILADSVIAELQKGNLKARFPIKKRDEFGSAMVRFNQMADEIELLVERLVNTEKSRMTLLQELAHDLRTPVASLKNLLETLQTREGSLQPQVKTELISLSVKEIDYFERLIEDLLILAQVSEPRYHPKKDSTDIVAILVDEGESAALHYSTDEKTVSFDKTLEVPSLVTQGDSLLLRRMFRNAVVNAFSFAKSKVHVTLALADETHATIVIDDDGPGFSEEAIMSFGIRRMTRVLGTEKNGRLSVGLGSVIVKTVVELHRGSVHVENRFNSMGKVEGARVTLTLSLFA